MTVLEIRCQLVASIAQPRNCRAIKRINEYLMIKRRTHSIQQHRNLTPAVHRGSVSLQAHHLAYEADALVLEIFEVRSVDTGCRLVHCGECVCKLLRLV
jgi:hypothetical protein